MTTLDTAIVGYGNAGADLHEPVVRSHPTLELTAVCDLDERRLDAVDGRVNRYTDVGAMLDREVLDSVHICTPPHTHVAVAEQILGESVPVLIEKPAAPSTEAVARLMEIADETDTLASVVHNRLFRPYVQEALASVGRGDIGDVVAVTMMFAQPQDLTETERGEWVFDLPGGEIGEGIVHQAYLPLAFVDGLGDVHCVVTQNHADYDDPIEFDGLSIQATDATGDRLVTITILTDSISKDVLYVYGTDGALQMDFTRMGTFRNSTNLEENPMTPTSYLTDNFSYAGQIVTNAVETGVDKVVRTVNQRFGDGGIPDGVRSHYVQTDRYVDAIRTGAEPPVSLRDAYDTVRILEAARV